MKRSNSKVGQTSERRGGTNLDSRSPFRWGDVAELRLDVAELTLDVGERREISDVLRPRPGKASFAARYAQEMRRLSPLRAIIGLGRRKRRAPTMEQKRIAGVLTPVRRRR
jgi:hypothetical protein